MQRRQIVQLNCVKGPAGSGGPHHLPAIVDGIGDSVRVTVHRAKLTPMRKFYVSCLTSPPALKPAQIKKLRQRLRISQPVFARFLNTSESTIEKWETGAKQPTGTALKLLSIVEKHGLEALP